MLPEAAARSSLVVKLAEANRAPRVVDMLLIIVLHQVALILKRPQRRSDEVFQESSESFQKSPEKFFLLHPSWTGTRANGRGGFSRERIPSEDARWLVGSSESGKRVWNVVGNAVSEGKEERRENSGLVFCYCSLKAGPPRRNAKLMSSRRRERLWHGDS